MVVSGGDKELRNLRFVQVRANGKVSRSSERADIKRILSFSTRLRVRSRAADGSDLSSYEIKRTLAAVDSAALVDHLKIRGFAFPIAPKTSNSRYRA